MSLPLTVGSNRQMAELPRPALSTRLYLVAGLLLALLLWAGALEHSGFHDIQNAVQYLIVAVVTSVVFYSCQPFIARIMAETDAKKVGIAWAILAVVVFTYLGSIITFINTQALAPVVNFSSLLLIFVSGGYFLEVKGNESSRILSEQKTQIDNILASLDEVIWSVDAHTLELLYTNNACCKVWGYTPAEMIKDKNTFLGAVHAEDRDMFYEALGNVLRNGAGHCEFRIIHRDTTTRYLRGQARLQKRPDGKTDVISGITMDITMQKMAELEACEMAKERENILNSINDAFFAINRNYVITYVNSEFRELYKDQAQDFVGMQYHGIAPKEMQHIFYQNCSKAMRENATACFEEYCIKLNKWFSYKVYPNENGASIYITDVTAQKELLQQVMAEKAKLEMQNQRLSEIAWIQSHKVRAPLANIMGLVALLDYEQPTHKDNIFILEGIRTASDRLDAVIKEISAKTNSLSGPGEYEKQYLHQRATAD